MRFFWLADCGLEVCPFGPFVLPFLNPFDDDEVFHSLSFIFSLTAHVHLQSSMVSGLSFFKSKSSSLPSPPTSPTTSAPPVTIQMPTVFVVPPEEDETPAWCCFDATGPTDASAATLPNRQHKSIALPKMPSSASRVKEAYPITNTVHPQETPIRSISQQIHEVGEDLEVNEVGRIKRNILDANGNLDEGNKRSKGFKHHASKAFRSLRGKKQVELKQQGIVANEGLSPPSSPSSPTFPRPRRTSLPLSQLFNPGLKARTSFDPAPASSPYRNPSFSSTAPSLNFQNAELVYPESEEEEYRPRGPSPTPSIGGSFKRRLSSLKLQKLFTPSAPPVTPLTSVPLMVTDIEREPTRSESISSQSVPSLSRDSSGPLSANSTISSRSGPITPTDEASFEADRGDDMNEHHQNEKDSDEIHLPEDLNHGIIPPRERSFSLSVGSKCPELPPLLPALTDGDLSLNMCLNSLRFGDMSFSVGEFKSSDSRL